MSEIPTESQHFKDRNLLLSVSLSVCLSARLSLLSLGLSLVIILSALTKVDGPSFGVTSETVNHGTVPRLIKHMLS